MVIGLGRPNLPRCTFLADGESIAAVNMKRLLMSQINGAAKVSDKVVCKRRPHLITFPLMSFSCPSLRSFMQATRKIGSTLESSQKVAGQMSVRRY